VQVKHADVVQVSLIIIAINSSTHLGRYTLTASNVAGSAAASISVRPASSSSSPSVISHSDAHHTPADDAQLQYPDSGYQQLSGNWTNCPTFCAVVTRQDGGIRLAEKTRI